MKITTTAPTFKLLFLSSLPQSPLTTISETVPGYLPGCLLLVLSGCGHEGPWTIRPQEPNVLAAFHRDLRSHFHDRSDRWDSGTSRMKADRRPPVAADRACPYHRGS